ncbi:hypothetical protein LB505_012165 [Fusarium chuoi]|nr:hypothetical protein LB505_012165 [Fusarium chuoi]
MVQAFPIYLPRQRELIATWVILPMLSNVTVGLRFYAKSKTRGVYGWTDWMIIASASTPAKPRSYSSIIVFSQATMAR